MPAGRSSHSVNAIMGKVAVFGGENAPRNAFDTHVHLLGKDGTWEKSANPLPCLPLLGHGSSSVDRWLYIFGGRAGGPNTFDGAQSGERGELFAYDTETGAWSRPAVGSTRPEPRSFHAMCSAGRSGYEQVFLFGGCGQRGRLNDVWAFDPNDLTWECLHPGGADAPKGRGGAALAGAVSESGSLKLTLIYGFSGEQQGDLAVFDTETCSWSIVEQEEQRGDTPSPRSVFCSAPLGDGKVFLFGGESVASDLGHAGAGEFTADSYLLDLHSCTWMSLPIEGEEAPEPRGWSGCAASDGGVLLFGGLNSSNDRLGDVWELPLQL